MEGTILALGFSLLFLKNISKLLTLSAQLLKSHDVFFFFLTPSLKMFNLLIFSRDLSV